MSSHKDIGADAKGDTMSTFRTLRPLVVDATQCEQSKTIATDIGFCNVSKGDWIVKGENGETYVVDDAFFQRTFTPLQTYPWEAQKEGRHYGC
jgi:hypothetical protein